MLNIVILFSEAAEIDRFLVPDALDLMHLLGKSTGPRFRRLNDAVGFREAARPPTLSSSIIFRICNVTTTTVSMRSYDSAR
eukprot:scaffold251197_cov18-Prasinocladus_malaysianus.AAC.1